MKQVFNFTILIGLPIIEQLKLFKFYKNNEYCLCVELFSGLDKRTLEIFVEENKMKELIEQSNDELFTIFEFINKKKIKHIKFYKMCFAEETFIFLGYLIEKSNLRYCTFDNVPSKLEFDLIIMPVILRSKLKSFNWINSSISRKEIEFLYFHDNIQNNKYLQQITINDANSYVSNRKAQKYYIDVILERNKHLASRRYVNTITLLLINRFGYLSFIPVDVFRLIAKKYYDNFILTFSFFNLKKKKLKKQKCKNEKFRN